MYRKGEKWHKKPPQQWDLLIKAYKKNSYETPPAAEKVVIPKIIHQIWLGSELPEKFKPLVKSWEKMHPHWEYHLWDDEAVKHHQFFSYRLEKLFEKATNYGMKSDILRIDLLYQYGGVYIDIDFECLKPLDPLHHTPSCKFYSALLGKDGVIANAFIGSVPKHIILRALLHKFQRIQQTECLSAQDVMQLTGPYAFTQVINQFIRSPNHNICIYPVNFFYPFPCEMRHYHWDQTLSKEKEEAYLHPYTFAVHYWATSWSK